MQEWLRDTDHDNPRLTTTNKQKKNMLDSIKSTDKKIMSGGGRVLRVGVGVEVVAVGIVLVQ